ncbi:MAG: methionine adenosyltransferase [Chloroflexi bacterium]|nr:MAG: methionine adenosyltransferase [Chloroflexota bacterium]
MPNITIEALQQIPVGEQRVELVERKGAGHPDSICDAIVEQVSVALCQEYLAAFGRVLHHNIDKGLLVAGITQPRLGGGAVLQPMRLILGDRATSEYKGKRIDVEAVAETSARDWLRQHLRFVDPAQHLIFQNELKQGSPELTDLFEREVIGANDTSAAVGYAPLTETEQLVLAAERYLNSPACKDQFPEAGEDVKVMGYRRDRELTLTVALAFVDRFVPDANTYFARKQAIREALEAHLHPQLRGIDRLVLYINTLDDPARGEAGMYLTVLGTSAEGGDCGQVGRGNKVNGVIALNRPMGTEAAAGKNPVSHVGKIYTLLTHQIAGEIYGNVPGLREVYVWLCSQIGQPIDRLLVASAQLILQPGVQLAEVAPAVNAIVEQRLATIGEFTKRLARGELAVW